MQTPSPFVQFRNVTKSYGGGSAIIRGLDLDIARGEFITILGPSGAGKTTILQMLAGLEKPDVGEILIDGQSMEGVAPHLRQLGAVFQNFALFPNLVVAENIAFPLRVRRVARRERKARVAEAIAMVRLDGLENRRPHQLSGGQLQRVALARALVSKPPIILLDEPLTALDQGLRDEMQTEIRQLQRKLGVTVLYVTHDQSEAMLLSDRIALLADGRVQQCDTPRSLYEKPASVAVASFLGATNRLCGVVVALDEDDDAMARIRLDCGLDVEAELAEVINPGGRCVLTVRPERIAVAAAAAEDFGAAAIPALVVAVTYLGDRARLRLTIGGAAGLEASEIIVTRPADAAAALATGETVAIAWQPQHARAFPQIRA